MRKILATILLCGLVMAANAVPAKRGWQTRTQADGTTIEVQLMGDEYYHYFVNRDGQQVRLNEAGMYEVVGQAPTANVARARRAAIKQKKTRKAKQEFGYTPNLAPKGLVIMVNFSDQSFSSSNTRAVIDSLCNAKNCKVNKYAGINYPSAGQYFTAQSDGQYNPVFDVYGPVTMANNYSYYGANDSDGNDKRPGNMILEACIKVNDQFDVDFSQYDSDNDGKVDFVYVIYAGEGEASGGSENTVWPHSYSLEETILYEQYYGLNYFLGEYSESDCYIDGVMINTYACSNEITSSKLNGIGTLCHEFGHVLGLPDWYDTNYGTNYESELTPNTWSIMDGGSYNGDGHCPPNYGVWEKYFFGWTTPINLGSNGANLSLIANGSEGYQAYQITTGDDLVNFNDSLKNNAAVYYIENRQQSGWDSYVPGHGMIIWKVQYSKAAWQANAPNNTDYAPRYTLVSASGSKIGYSYNPYPGSYNVTSKTVVTGKPLLNIAESNSVVTLTYIEEPAVDPFDVVFYVDGEPYDTIQSTGSLVLPADPAACSDGKEFVGWSTESNYSNETTAPALYNAGSAVSEGAIFYAIFAEVTESAEASIEDVLNRASTGVEGTSYASWENVTATSSAVYAGQSAGGNSSIQLRSNKSNSGIVTTTSGGTLKKVAVEWNENTAEGRMLDVYGSNTAYTAPTELYGSGKNGTKIGSITFGTSTSLDVTDEYTYVGVRSNSGAVYLNSITFTWSGSGTAYSNYSTSCGSGSDVEDITTPSEQPKVRKIIRNGHVYVIRDGIIYNVLGRVVQ